MLPVYQPMGGYREKVAIYKSGSTPSLNIGSARALTLDFSGSGTLRSAYHFSHPVYNTFFIAGQNNKNNYVSRKCKLWLIQHYYIVTKVVKVKMPENTKC